MEETIKLKCEKCGCDYEKPSVFKEYLVATKHNVFYKWSLAFCDRCRKEKERESLKALPDVLRALGEKMNLRLLSVMGSFLLMLLNAGGTIAWINLYTSGRNTEWWVFVLITVCGLAALIFASKFAKSIRWWLF